MENASSQSCSPPPKSRQRWIEGLLVFLVFFIHAAEPVPDVNEPHYLTKARHYWNPDWLAGDFFLESVDAHVVFYWTFGWVTQLVPLAAAAWIGRLVTWGFMAWAWQRLSETVIPGKFLSVLSAAVFVTMTEQGDLAGEWVVGGVEAKGFAYVFVLLGLERLVRNRWNVAWILFGVAAAFHILVGGWTVLAALIGWSLGRDRLPFRSMLPGLVCGGALAAIGLWPALALSYGQPADVVQEANQIYVFERLPHHLALLSQEPDRLLERVLRHGAALIALVVLIVLRQRWTRDTTRTQGNQPAQSDDAEAERLARIRRFVVAALLFTGVGLTIELALGNRPILAASVLRYYWYRLGDFAVPLGLAMYAAEVVLRALASRQAVAAAVLVAMMAFPTWYLADVTRQRLADPAPRTERGNKIRNWPDWLDATDWIRRHTRADARFLTPRSNQTFKWRAERSEVASHKDIPQDARGIVEWRRRMDAIYRFTNDQGERETVKSLGHHGTERVLELARKYDADYVLTDNRRYLTLPVAYANETYVVYRVPNATP